MGFRYSMTIKFKKKDIALSSISFFSDEELKTWADFHPHIKRVLGMPNLQLGDYEVWNLESSIEDD